MCLKFQLTKTSTLLTAAIAIYCAFIRCSSVTPPLQYNGMLTEFKHVIEEIQAKVLQPPLQYNGVLTL
jgi:hypothetical protein